jgi:hypothetical protein
MPFRGRSARANYLFSRVDRDLRSDLALTINLANLADLAMDPRLYLPFIHAPVPLNTHAFDFTVQHNPYPTFPTPSELMVDLAPPLIDDVAFMHLAMRIGDVQLPATDQLVPDAPPPPPIVPAESARRARRRATISHGSTFVPTDPCVPPPPSLAFLIVSFKRLHILTREKTPLPRMHRAVHSIPARTVPAIGRTAPRHGKSRLLPRPQQPIYQGLSTVVSIPNPDLDPLI